MKKVFGFIGVLLLAMFVFVTGFVLLRPKPPVPPESVKSLVELEIYFDQLTGYNAASPPGLSVVVVKDGAPVYQEGFGLADGPRGIPAAPDTVYNQWSMTKVFTAVAILQLQEKGLLDIDDPVTDYLSFFDVQYPSDTSETITLRHLLTHSSGLPNNVPEVIGWVHTDGDPEWNQTELLKAKLPDYTKLEFEPGLQGTYTNMGYMVLAAVIEKVSGQSYESYVVEKILSPLGMDLTGFTYTEAMKRHEAVGSHPRWDTITPLFPIMLDNLDDLVREKNHGRIWFNHVYSDQNGPTGLIGPPTDTARFLMAYLNEGELDGRRILSAESVAMMTNDCHITAGSSPETIGYEALARGLGWVIVPEEDGSFYLAHSGGGPGFAAAMRLYPDRDLGIVMMANGTYLPQKGIMDLLQSLEW
ncbi:MAG: serine hydrolase [Anaerolineales bacterium]|nr:serine hydrolase [Anaerolineales bacterium]